MPGVFHGLKNRPGSEAVLVIGVHREELAFGDKVADDLDPSLADLLCIPEGLSGQRPRQDQLFYWVIRSVIEYWKRGVTARQHNRTGLQTR